jgi:hypothetical protein
MKTAEEQIRDLLIDEEHRAPLAADAMPGIQRGIVRSRQRRMGAAVAAVVAVAAAITVPVVMHDSSSPHPATTQSGTHASKPAPGITVRSMFAPTWLPAGLVETGRNAQIHSRPDNHPAFVDRYFSSTDPKNHASVSITDAGATTTVPKSATPVTIAGRSGMGWIDKNTQSYVIQVKWSAGHWLTVWAADSKPSKEIAIRVGNSIAVRHTTLHVPLTCSGPGCKAFNGTSVSGATNRQVLIDLVGDPLIVELDHSSSTAPGNVGIRLDNGMYAHFENAPGAKHPLTHAQLLAIAKTFRVHGKLDFSWLGKRP